MFWFCVVFVIWALFSAAGLVGLTGGDVLGVHVSGLPYNLGWIIYFCNTLVYVFGVLDTVSRSGN